MERSYSRIRSYLLLLLTVLVLGTLAIMLTEGLALFDAFYFVVVTIATVGYGDITPQNIYGKAVALILILAGVGTFIAIFAEIISVWDKIREIPVLFYRDHVIICGMHETTKALVQQFGMREGDLLSSEEEKALAGRKGSGDPAQLLFPAIRKIRQCSPLPV